MASFAFDANGNLVLVPNTVLPPKRLKTVRELILERRQNSENSLPNISKNFEDEEVKKSKPMFISQMLCTTKSDSMADEMSKSDSQISYDDTKQDSINLGPRPSEILRKRRLKRLSSDEIDSNVVEEILKKYPTIAPKSVNARESSKSVEKQNEEEEIIGNILQSKENVPENSKNSEPKKLSSRHLKLNDLSLEDVSRLTLDDILRLGISEIVNETELKGILTQMENSLSHANPKRCKHTPLGFYLCDYESSKSSKNKIESCESNSSPTEQNKKTNTAKVITETVDIEKEQYMDYFSLKPNINKVQRRKFKFCKYVKVLNGHYKEYMRNPSIPLSRIRNFYWYLKWLENKDKITPIDIELKKSEGNVVSVKQPSNVISVPKPSNVVSLQNLINVLSVPNPRKLSTENTKSASVSQDSSTVEHNPKAIVQEPKASITANESPLPALSSSTTSSSVPSFTTTTPMFFASGTNTPVLLLIPPCSTASSTSGGTFQPSIISLQPLQDSHAAPIPSSTIINRPSMQVISTNAQVTCTPVNSVQTPLVLNTPTTPGITILRQPAPVINPATNSAISTIALPCIIPSSQPPSTQVYSVNSQSGSMIFTSCPSQSASIVTDAPKPFIAASGTLLLPTSTKEMLLTDNQLSSKKVNNSNGSVLDLGKKLKEKPLVCNLNDSTQSSSKSKNLTAVENELKCDEELTDSEEDI